MKPNKNAYGTGIFIIGILFFIFGFVTWLNATLIPYLNIACELTEEWQGYLVTSPSILPTSSWHYLPPGF